MKKYLIDKHNQEQYNQLVNNLNKLAFVAELAINKDVSSTPTTTTTTQNQNNLILFKKQYNLRQIIKTPNKDNPCFLLRKDINFYYNNNNNNK